jgi:methyl-accepting chemotaxis protein
MARWPFEVAVWLTAFVGALIPALLVGVWLGVRAGSASAPSGGEWAAVVLAAVVLAAIGAAAVMRAARRPLYRLAHAPLGDPWRTLPHRGVLGELAARLASAPVAEPAARPEEIVAAAAPTPIAATSDLLAASDAIRQDPPAASHPSPRAPSGRIPDTAPADLRRAVQRLTMHIGEANEATRRQATSVQNTIRQMEMMAVSASGVSERTTDASAVAGEAVAAVHTGQDALTHALAAMALIRETTLRAARQVKVLGESGQFVRQAVGQVQYNADELHLIAGNASIEAARHPHAAGFFRNVADSIEQLAQQSAVALAEIQHAIEANRQETSRVAGVIEDVVAEVSRGSAALGAAGGALDTITEVVGRLAALNTVIAQASQEQAQVAATVAESIDLLAGNASETLQGAAEQATLVAHIDALVGKIDGAAVPHGAVGSRTPAEIPQWGVSTPGESGEGPASPQWGVSTPGESGAAR